MNGISNQIQTELFLLQDEAYKAFNKKLVPTVAEDTMIGIRTPVLRKFAKTLFKTRPDDAELFMHILPHRYFEENNLHAFLIECIQDIDQAAAETERFLPFIDNWETCDLFSPPVFKKSPDRIYRHILTWLQSPHCYTVRYGIGLLLSNYLDEEFKREMLDLVADIISGEYYVNMMIAWYFSTALVKQYAAAIPYIETKRLRPFTHNKAIQKAVESTRISPEIKAYLKTLKIR
ncbi:MAG: DNA alkylation repair protein [Treponema sp.]